MKAYPTIPLGFCFPDPLEKQHDLHIQLSPKETLVGATWGAAFGQFWTLGTEIRSIDTDPFDFQYLWFYPSYKILLFSIQSNFTI